MTLRWLLPLSLLLLLSGALGLEFETSTCDSYVRDVNKMSCYYRVALSYAYIGDSQTATDVCNDIYDNLGAYRSRDDDLAKKAELTANNCIYDVAKIARDPSICAWIGERYDRTGISMNLYGAETSRSTCINDTARLAQIAPENYYRNNPNNLCAIVYILPLFLALAIIKSG